MFQWLCDIPDSLGLTATSILWTLGIGVLLALVSIGFVTALVILLPANYFLERSERGLWVDRHPVVRWTLIVLKNLLGVVLVIGGVIMLFGPGQGVLTILIGVMLLDFPGKRQLELKLVSRPRVLEAINKLRARFGRPPMHLPEPGPFRESQASRSRQSFQAATMNCDGTPPTSQSAHADAEHFAAEHSAAKRSS